VILAAIFYAAQLPWTLEGQWTNERQSVVVSIAPCRGGEAMCGVVSSASEKAKADARRGGTPDLLGVELLHEFILADQNRWSGTLFVPDLNKRSKAQIVKLDEDRLRIRGCLVGRMLCRSQVWTRVRD